MTSAVWLYYWRLKSNRSPKVSHKLTRIEVRGSSFGTSETQYIICTSSSINRVQLTMCKSVCSSNIMPSCTKLYHSDTNLFSWCWKDNNVLHILSRRWCDDNPPIKSVMTHLRTPTLSIKLLPNFNVPGFFSNRPSCASCRYIQFCYKATKSNWPCTEFVILD